MNAIHTWWVQLRCKHRIRVGDIRRIDDQVEVPCCLCCKVLSIGIDRRVL